MESTTENLHALVVLLPLLLLLLAAAAAGGGGGGGDTSAALSLDPSIPSAGVSTGRVSPSLRLAW